MISLLYEFVSRKNIERMEKWNFYFLTFVFLFIFFIIFIKYFFVKFCTAASSLCTGIFINYLGVLCSWFFVLFKVSVFDHHFFFYCPRVSGPVYFCIFIIFFLLMKRTFVLRHVCNIVPKVISSTIRTTNFFPIQRQVQHNNIAFILLKIT